MLIQGKEENSFAIHLPDLSFRRPLMRLPAPDLINCLFSLINVNQLNLGCGPVFINDMPDIVMRERNPVSLGNSATGCPRTPSYFFIAFQLFYRKNVCYDLH